MKRTIVLAAILALAACGEEPTGIRVGFTSTAGTTSSANQAISALTLAPATLALNVGGTGTLNAVPTGPNGLAVAGVTVAFTSSNEAVATVSRTGVVSARGVGTATITANAGGRTSSAVVTVADR